MAFVEAPQTMEEVANVPKLVRGPCLLNVVYGGKTPEIDLREAQKMGYRLAIVPGLLFKTVMASCDDALAALKKEHRHPVPGRPMTVQQAFARVGANDWDPLRTAFREPTAKAAE
jgi:2-methylisocitrate lyase-like PEP mutase family enzyme